MSVNIDNTEGSKVIIDLITLETSLETLQLTTRTGRIPDFHSLNIAALSNFIEALVLFETVFIDQSSLDASSYELSKQFIGNQELGFIKGIKLDEMMKTGASLLALAISQRQNTAEVINTARSIYANVTWGREYVTDPKNPPPHNSFVYLQSADVDSLHYLPKNLIPTGLHYADRNLILCAYRAWYYFGLAVQTGITYLPNDYRAIFLREQFTHKPSAIVILEKMEEIIFENDKKLDEWFQEKPYIEQVRWPVLFNYVVSKAKSRVDIINIALELRESAEAKKFRYICSELDYARKYGTVNEVSKLIKKVEAELSNQRNGLEINDEFEVTLSLPPSLTFKTTRFETWLKRRELMFLRKIATDSKHLNTSIRNFRRLMADY